MIGISINPNQIELAKSRLIGKVLNNSITMGKSELYGKVAEVVIEDLYDGKYVSNFDYDLIVKQKTIDVKAKKRTVKPEPHYYVTVFDFNTTQKCDYYCFVSVMNDMSMAYICGWMKPEEFYAKATFNKKGDIDPTDNKFIFKADSYNLKIKDLHL